MNQMKKESRAIRAVGASISQRYVTLRERHRALGAKLAAERLRPQPDNLLLQRIKRRKLLIKDELARLERLFRAIGVDVGEYPQVRLAVAASA